MWLNSIISKLQMWFRCVK